MDKKNISFFKKSFIFTLTLLIRISAFAVFSFISRIKKPMSEDLNFSESFLGTMSTFGYLGRTLGSLYMCIMPAERLKINLNLGFFLMLASIALIPFSGLVQYSPRLLISLGCFSAGFFRAFIIITYYFLKQFMGTSNLQNSLVAVWLSTGEFGDIAGILLTEILITNLGLQWQTAGLVLVGMFMVIELLSFLTLDEMVIENQNDTQKKCAKLVEFKDFIFTYYKQLSNVLHTVSFTLVGVTYYLTIMWLPYYFFAIGYSSGSSFIAITYPLSFILGNFLYTYFAGHLFKYKFIGHINFLLLVLILGLTLILTQLRNDLADVPAYCIIIFLTGFLISGPETNIFGHQVEARASNSFERSNILNINSLIVHLASALVFLGSGFILESNIYSLFWLLTGFMVASTAIYGLRLCFHSEQFIVKSEELPSEEVDDVN